MTIDGLDDNTIHDILTMTTRIALVGASTNPDRPSNNVMLHLLRRGYDVTPINPILAGQKLHGRIIVASLLDALPLEMVDLFRAPSKVSQPVHDAIRLGAKTIWMQLGVIDTETAAFARQAGLIVVMDRCPLIEMARLRI